MADNQMITFMMPRHMYVEIQHQTKRRNKSQAAIYREAIAAWLENEAGVVVDIAVAHGGDRSPRERRDGAQ